MKKWTKARQNGNLVDLPGLVKRRAAEAELFQKPVTATPQSRSCFGSGSMSMQHSLSGAGSYAYRGPRDVAMQQSGYSFEKMDVSEQYPKGEKYTLQHKGAEMIETSMRLFYPETNIFPAGVKNQDQGPRHLLGWLKIDMIVE